jgi:hypothetical protein
MLVSTFNPSDLRTDNNVGLSTEKDFERLPTAQPKVRLTPRVLPVAVLVRESTDVADRHIVNSQAERDTRDRIENTRSPGLSFATKIEISLWRVG